MLYNTYGLLITLCLCRGGDCEIWEDSFSVDEVVFVSCEVRDPGELNDRILRLENDD